MGSCHYGKMCSSEHRGRAWVLRAHGFTVHRFMGSLRVAFSVLCLYFVVPEVLFV